MEVLLLTEPTLSSFLMMLSLMTKKLILFGNRYQTDKSAVGS